MKKGLYNLLTSTVKAVSVIDSSKLCLEQNRESLIKHFDRQLRVLAELKVKLKKKQGQITLIYFSFQF